MPRSHKKKDGQVSRSVTARLPPDILERIENIRRSALVAPSEAAVLRAVIEKGLEVLEADHAKPQGSR